MSEILPCYGIIFRTIRRKEINGEVISASRVRKCIDEGRVKEVEKLVPISTLDYIRAYDRRH